MKKVRYIFGYIGLSFYLCVSKIRKGKNNILEYSLQQIKIKTVNICKFFKNH
uniref:Transmembrane protein n=1 Tax=Myoviridae sp. ctPuP5 TaxID=2823543 RepID=A0A8S5L9R2_9CAUD|nr:MAG TPA: transmembrane protein [Myoviridae sp. ctPuP5]